MELEVPCVRGIRHFALTLYSIIYLLSTLPKLLDNEYGGEPEQLVRAENLNVNT